MRVEEAACLDCKDGCQSRCELWHAMPFWAVHVYAVDHDVVLHKSDEEAGEVRIHKLEAEVLCNSGVLMLQRRI